MNVVRFVFFFFVSLIIFSKISSQSLIVDRQYYNYELKINYNNSNTTEDLPNYFIDQIARSIPKHYLSTNYKARINLELILYKKSKTEYLLKLKNNSFLYSGDYKYKGFDVKNIIFPQKLQAKIVFVDLNSQSETTFEINNRVDFSESYLLDTIIIDTSSSKSYNIESSYFEFVFFTSQKDDFIKMQNAVDKYENSGFEIKKIREKIAAIKLNQPSMTPIYKMQINDIRNELEAINPDVFYKDFENLKKDPLNLFREYKYLNNKLNKLDSLLDLQLVKMDYAYFQKGINEFNNANYNNAKSYFKLSLKNNPYKSESVLMLAKIDFQLNNTDSAIIKLIYILEDLKPNTKAKNDIIIFSEELLNKALSQGEYLINNDQFDAAIKLIELTQKFCDKPIIECDNQLNNLLSRAKYGFFNSYLEIAEMAIQRNRADLAVEYIIEAEKFQAENADYIIGDAQIYKLKNRIFSDFESGIILNIQKKNYSVALKQIESLKKFLDGNNISTHNDEYIRLKSKLHQAIFNQMLNRAIQIQKQSGVEAADMFINDAIKYANDNSNYVRIGSENQNNIEKIKSEAIKKNIIKIKEYIENGQETQARIQFKQIKNFEKFINNELKTEFNELSLYLKDEKIDKMIREADSLQFHSNYFEAVIQIDKAIEIAKEKRPDYIKILDAKKALISAKLCRQSKDSTIFFNDKFNEYIEVKDFKNALSIYYQFIRLKEKTDCDLINNYQKSEIEELKKIDFILRKKDENEDLWKNTNYKDFINNYFIIDSVFNTLRYYRNDINHQKYNMYFIQHIDNKAYVKADLEYHYEKTLTYKAFVHLKMYYSNNDLDRRKCDKLAHNIIKSLVILDKKKMGYEKSKYGINKNFGNDENIKLKRLIKLYNYHWALSENKSYKLLIYQIFDNKLINCN